MCWVVLAPHHLFISPHENYLNFTIVLYVLVSCNFHTKNNKVTICYHFKILNLLLELTVDYFLGLEMYVVLAERINVLKL